MSDSEVKNSSVADELRGAYEATHFNVLEPTSFTLRIGETSRELADLYRNHSVSTAGFLTAWNPFSKPTSQQENERAQRVLERQLYGASKTILRGMGGDASGEWPGEPSVLALGISRDTAIRLGNEFRQNAIVWIGSVCVPELVFLR